MQVYKPYRAGFHDMTRFHSEEYINFLSNAGHTHVTPPIKTLPSFNVGDDCPLFPGLYNVCSMQKNLKLQDFVMSMILLLQFLNF